MPLFPPNPLPVSYGGTGVKTLGASKAALYANSAGNAAGSAVVTIDEVGQFLDIAVSANSTLQQLTNYSGASVNGANTMFRKARGTPGAPTKVLSGDFLGGMFARGYEEVTPGFAPSSANAMRFEAEEDYTATACGTACVIAVSKLGAASGVETFRVNGNGYLKLSPQSGSSGSIKVFTFIAAANTNQTASTEINEVLWNFNNTLQFATGTVTTQRTCRITPRTYSFVGASVITTAATLAIGGAPIAGTNATITNNYSLWCQGGIARFDGGISAGSAITGEAQVTSPYGVHGGVAFAFASDANYVVTAAQYALYRIQFDTGAWTVGRTVTFPAPATAALGYEKTIFNNTSKTITVSTGTGTTKTLTTGLAQKFWFDNAGVSYNSATWTP